LTTHSIGGGWPRQTARIASIARSAIATSEVSSMPGCLLQNGGRPSCTHRLSGSARGIPPEVGRVGVVGNSTYFRTIPGQLDAWFYRVDGWIAYANSVVKA
jgi:hypothetical protein